MHIKEIRVGLLAYFVGIENVYVVLLDQQGKAQNFRLASWREMFPLVDRLSGAMERKFLGMVPIEFREFSLQWGKELLPPAAVLKPFDVLIIIPHYSLHGLPFHTIYLDEEKTFLAASHGVAYCSSATLLSRCAGRNRARESDLSSWQFFFDETAPFGAPPVPRNGVGVAADIIGNRTEEYRQVAETFTGYFEHSVANLASRDFKNRLRVEPRWEAICIVCHGYFDALLPDNSGLLLEEPMGISVRQIPLHRGKYYDFRDLPFSYLPAGITPRCEAEIMTVGELKVGCQTDAEIVALFGCSTAAGHLTSGEEFSAMAYQWLKIGAASALANSWEASIEFILRWSPLFLENWLVKRQPKAIAWREANKALLEQNSEMSSYEWGVISLFGDWL